MKIQSTNNYTLFQSNPFQRAFRQSKVNEIIEKMRVNGYPPSMAISVYRAKDGKLVINTGHHRLAAAKSLGIHVLYVIEHQWTLKEMVDEGVTGSKWDAMGVCQNFAKAGNKQYQELLGYVDKGIPLTMAASLLIGEGAASGNATAKLASGGFKIKTRDRINKILELIEELGSRCPAVKHRPFITAYSKCLFTPEFDRHTFTRRLGMNPMMLEKTSNEDQMLKQIEEIYNFKSQSKIPLAFLVTKHSLARKTNFGKVATH